MYTLTGIRWVAYITSTYLLFNAYSYLFGAANLVNTPRNLFVFEHIISRPAVITIYVMVALLLAAAFSFPKILSVSLGLVATINLFWAIMAVLPALVGSGPAGSLTGASTLLAFSAVLFLLSFVSYRTYNWKQE